MRTVFSRTPKAVLFSAALLALGACTDGDLVGPPAVPAPLGPAPAIEALTCTASLRDGSVECGPAGPALGGSATIIGGQNVNVKLTSSNVSYSALDSIFRFDVTIQNLLKERMGTRDGVTVDSLGVRVFFAAEPTATSGTGSVDVDSVDGRGVFSAANQPYYQYVGVLDSGAVSAPRTWRMKVDPTVATFSFAVYVEAKLQPLIVINELMANPGGAVQDSTGEYVELYNAGRFPVNLNGFQVSDNGGSHTIASDLIVPGGGYALLGRSTNTAKNGGISPAYVYVASSTQTTLQFSNSGADFFRLRLNGVTVDSAGYTNTATAAAAGVARELTNPALDNTSVDGSNWAAATGNYEGSNKGTPGTANGTGTPLPPPGPPVTVVVSPSPTTAQVGGTRQLTATARDSLSQLSTTTFTWTSLDADVASVNGSGLVTGVASGTAGIVATASNGVADTATVTVSTAPPPTTGLSYLDHLEFGTPTDGTPANELILTKPQFALSYSEVRGGPNWVSWNLNASHFGPADRCNCFLSDPQLPDSIYRVVTGDYTGSGYTRGHMVMSAQRTFNADENAVTYLMTNMLPQLSDLNSGPWLQFENYNNDLARAGAKELYVIAGGLYSASPATLNNAGKVQIPTHTWKIVVIVDRGEGVESVSSAADVQVIAVNMPNQAGISSQPWTNYRVSVDALEALTGYDFLSLLPDAVEAAVEATAS